jgi:propanol-preferring alcohol dehydrogenase
MKAMVLNQPKTKLSPVEVPIPRPGKGQVLIQVSACGVCRTDLHICDGELPNPVLPLILGHEIVGIVCEIGEGVENIKLGSRVGVPWLGFTCGECEYCKQGLENLCDRPGFTGYTLPGGYAEYLVAYARYVFCLPDLMDDEHSAPLLCAGLIGYRSYRMLPASTYRIGILGFGAAAHIITQIAVAQGKLIYAFTRPRDEASQDFAIKIGAVWAGGSDQKPPDLLDGAIIFAPAGSLIPTALSLIRKGCAVICGGIHMSEIPAFPYSVLWEERSIKSVANLTRQDGDEFFKVIANIPLYTQVINYRFQDANQALADLRAGRFQGAAVLSLKENHP